MTLLLAAESFAIGPTTTEILASVLYYVGMLALIGCGTVVILDSPRVMLRRIVSPVWAVAGIGALAVGFLRYESFNLPLAGFVDTVLGRAAVIRFGGLMLAFVGVVMLALNKRRGAWWILAGAAASVFGHASGGHANIASVPLVARIVQAIHVVSIGAWIGGLGMMLASTRGEPTEDKARLVARFSNLAGVAVVIVAATGVLRAFDTVGISWGALTETSYGRFILFKSQLLLLLVVFGAHNRYKEVPRAKRVMRNLRRIGIAELATALIVLSITGVMSGTEPAGKAYAEQRATPGEIVQLDPGVTISELETPENTLITATWPDGVKAIVYADPETPGVNELHVTMFGDDGRELELTSFVPMPGRSTPTWDPPQRFSKGHFTIRADLASGSWMYAYSAGASTGARYRVIVPFEIG